MAVKVTVAGKVQENTSGFSVSEDSTPLDPSDTVGAVGQYTFGLAEENVEDNPRFLKGKTAALSDGTQGQTTGTVTSVAGRNGDLTFTVASRIAQIAVERVIQPFTGTLGDYLELLLASVGITSFFNIDSDIEDIPIVALGYTGNVWDLMKRLCTARQIEISLVSSNVVFRSLRQRTAQVHRDSGRGWTVDESRMARSVQVNYYEKVRRVGALVYPSGGWTPETPVLVVNAGETIETNVPLKVSLESIDQPICVPSVSAFYEASSVYTVTGNDGLPIMPAQWAADGGSVSVQINEDTRSITITVTAPSDARLSPFKIAMPSGVNESYSSLRIIGTGIHFDQKSIILHTSVDPDKVSEEIGTVVDNEQISSSDDAYHAGMWAVRGFSGTRNIITRESAGINRLGDSGSYAYPTIDDFNAIYGSGSVNSFNAIYAGQTVEDVNAFLRSLTANNFENQAFGNVSGARVFEGDAWFRIRSATLDPSGVSFSAESDTIVDDWNGVWGGLTVNDYNASWAGYTVADAATAPLRKVS